MKLPIATGRSLSYYGTLAWVVPSLMAIGACVFVFIGSAGIESRNGKQHVLNQLIEESNIVARRVSAELLIGPRGAPDTVGFALGKEFGLSSVHIQSETPSCWSNTLETCSVQSKNNITLFRKIPIVAETRFVSVSKPIPDFTSYLRFENLLWSTIPIALMLGLGLIFQRWILRRYFLRPVRALVETSTGDKEPRAYWPKELKDISEQLYRSFEQRDEAIFSQIARGVIHDLRTLIQSPLAALELAQESKNTPDKRLTRLDNLESVAGQQLPKIRDIIDTTLDGSREIFVSPKQTRLESTILDTTKTLAPLLLQTKTALSISGDLTNLSVAHDALQLERALTNLLKNGIEAASQKAPSNRKVQIEVSESGNSVCIDFEDSGPGLTVNADRLFRPLKSTKPHGSGLGLVISRKIVTAHGGTLTPGRSKTLGGAKFSVVLPKESEAT